MAICASSLSVKISEFIGETCQSTLPRGHDLTIDAPALLSQTQMISPTVHMFVHKGNRAGNDKGP